jgi:homoserine kinase type II
MAVYTEVSDEDLNGFLAEYDIGGLLSCKGIAEGIENSNYLLKTTTGSFILTLFEKRVDPEDLPFFLGLLDHLAARGVPCPTPVKGRDGNALRELSGRPAAAVTFLDGLCLGRRRITPGHCSELGRAMAEMHLAGMDFAGRRENDLSVGSWRRLFETCAGRADEIKPGLAETLDRELAALEDGWPDGLAKGVIHADLFPDNVFFQGPRLSGIIDFYFACSDFFAYDLAVCLNAWCFEGEKAFNVTKARRMLLAYRKVRDFSASELAALPLLARGAAMRFLLTRLYDRLNKPENARVTPKDPLEYLQKLRFHQGVAGPGAYGLD